MVSKFIIVSVLIAVVSAQHLPAAQYPPGVNPALCPGYPNCDNALLHNPQPAHHAAWQAQPAPTHWGAPAPQWTQPAPQWAQPAPQWAQPSHQWDGPSNHLDGAGGDKYPAGVNPHSCPNYPFCDTPPAASHPQIARQHVEPLPGWTERQYPAGVSAHECPNFPYCH